MNLLVALDALLEEQSVTGAAARLRTSAPAMSRTLGRIRRVLGDPVLVRAGRNLVPTPRALELRADVHAVVQQARGLLTPHAAPDPARLARQFTLQTSDMLLAALATPLTALAQEQAPGVSLRFLPESVEDTPALRDGRVDLEIGVLDHLDPETRTESLTELRLVGAVRPGHRLATARRVTPRAFAAADHISVSRKGRRRGPIDDRLAELGLERRVPVAVPSHTVGLFLAQSSDLVCLAPAVLARHCVEALGLRTFPVPLELPPLDIGMAWHPRNDADSAHRWLRERVREAFAGLADDGRHEYRADEPTAVSGPSR